MITRIDTRSGLPIFRQLYDQIERQILGGKLSPGEQMPSVRELSVELKINPMTLSKVYSMLESGGYLERKRGIGLFVASGKRSNINSEKHRIVSSVLRSAALEVIQLGVDEKDAIEILAGHFRTINKGNKTGGEL
jgi:GntR family transcriptional regulator